MAKQAKQSKWSKMLKKGAAAWNASEENYKEMFSGKDVPNGSYVGPIQTLEFMVTKEGTPQESCAISRKIAITAGKYKGYVVSDRLNPFHEMGGAFLRNFLKVMGLDPNMPISELEDVVEAINEQNPVVQFTVKQGEFTNIVVTALLDSDDVENLPEDTGTDEGEEGEGEEGEGEEGGEVDLDSYNKEELLTLITDQEIDCEDLGFKTTAKMKKAGVKALRAAVKKLLEESEEGEGEEGGEEGGEDEALEACKLFAAAQDIELADDADLDDAREAIAKKTYLKADLDADEVELLKCLELTENIKEKKEVKAKEKKKLNFKIKKK